MVVTLFTIQTPGTKTIWDIRDILEADIKWTTDIDFAAGELTFKTVEVDEGFTPKNGDIVKFQWDHKKVFAGRIFKFDYDQTEVFSITAYDNLRYFKNQDSLVWPVSTISQRFTKVCKLAAVKGKVVNKSTHKLRAEVCDGKSYFDMLKDSFKATKSATGHRYFLFDNYGTVELRRSPFKKIPYYIGDKSTMTDFTYTRSIENVANVVKVVRTDKKKKGSSTSTAKASGKPDPKNTKFTYQTATGSTLKRWGKLQIVEKAKDKANAAQMKKKAHSLLKSKAKQEHTLKITAMGTISMIPGNYYPIKIKSLKQVGIGTKYVLIQKATHTFTGQTDTAELEVKVGF